MTDTHHTSTSPAQTAAGGGARRWSALAAASGAPRWLRLALLAIGLLLAWQLPNMLYPPVAIDIACWALLAVSVDLLLGYAGLLSFGHAAFWGSAAYTAALVATHTDLPFPIAVLAGALVAAVLAVPIGYLAVRRTGIYFAMVTLAFAQMIYFVANEWRSVTGGENGVRDVPRSFFGADLTDPYDFYYYALPLVLAGLWLAWRIAHSPFGRVLEAIRDNTARTRALGYSAQWYKLTAFVLSAFLAGLGGGIFAISHGLVSLDAVHWSTSGKAVILVVLGGIGTLWGGVVGAAIVVRLEDWLSLQHFDQVGLVTGGIFVLVVLVFRRGVWGTAVHLVQRWTRDSRRDT